MRLFFTGATGLIGRRLVVDRLERGDRVVLVSRDAARASALFAAEANPNVRVFQGSPAMPGPWQKEVDGCDAVVHLAGAGVADRRWNEAYKKLIVSSRIDSTHQVVEAINAASHRPRVFVSASAVGIYGDTGDRETDESGAVNAGDFFGDLVMRWESEAMRADEASSRTVLLRTGVVLDPRGGLLGSLVRPFRMYLGGPIGSGRQYVPWIHWRDLVGLVDLALREESLKGPLNATAPNSATSREFSRALGGILHRPSWLPMPALVLRLVIGEMGRYAAMSQRIFPARARKLGFRFAYPQIDAALESLLAVAPIRRQPPGRRPPGGQGPPRRSGRALPTATTPARPIRLLAIGVDGTLLRSDGRLPQAVVRACRAAHRAGCVVAPATARPPRSMRAIMQALDIAAPAITYNGAMVWNPLDDRPQFHEPLDGALARRIIDVARHIEPDVLVGIEVLDRWFTDRIDPSRAPGVGRMIEPDDVGPLDRYLSAPITQLNLFGTPVQVAAARTVIEQQFWRQRLVALHHDEPWLVRIVHPMADKGIALQRIAQHVGIGQGEVAAIGDGANDAGMVGWAGFGIAVANSSQRLLDIADAVVPANNENGVARAIQRYVLARD